MYELSSQVTEAIDRISNAKQARLDGADWYPYDSFGNAEFFFELLGRIGDRGPSQFANVLDVGCGDGDLSFLFERLGSNVVAVDWPRTNYNGMRGVRTLKERLASNVEIVDTDLEDGLASLGERRFDLVLVAGVLYHLENPLRVLRDARLRARHCFLSTKVLTRFPGWETPVANEPVAYLLENDELNQDSTNYWLPTPAAVDRLCRRAGWKTMASTVAGEEDERMYAWLERGDLLTNGVVLGGLFEPEGWNEWRWAERKFAVRFENRRGGPGRIRLRVHYLQEFWAQWGTIAVELSANGGPAQIRQLATPGIHELTWDIGGTAGVLNAEFLVSRATAPTPQDERELSLVVLSARYGAVS